MSDRTSMKAGTPVGIDLGSLHARVAIVEQSAPKVIANDSGERFTVAIVHKEESYSQQLDSLADPYANNNEKEGAAMDGASYVFGEAARRTLIRERKEPTSVQSLLTQDGEQQAEAAAAFLGHLCRQARHASSFAHLPQLVVSVPVAASPRFVRALKAAVTAAGSVERVGVVSDAAAVCMAHVLSDSTHVLVVDWGASGLTITHFRRLAGMLSVARTLHDASLSGRVLASLLASHCAHSFERQYRIPVDHISKKSLALLHIVCENEALSTLARGAQVTVTVDGFHDGLDINVKVTRARFDMLCAGLLTKAESLLATFVEDVDVALMAGNVMQMPTVLALMDKLFSTKLRHIVPPEEAVAIGCAMYANTLLSHSHYHDEFNTLSEVTEVSLSPCSIGIRGDDTTMQVLIPIGTPLPANVTCTLSNDGDIVQVQNDGSEKVVGRLEGIQKPTEGTMELSIDGTLTLAINGGESVIL